MDEKLTFAYLDDDGYRSHCQRWAFERLCAELEEMGHVRLPETHETLDLRLVRGPRNWGPMKASDVATHTTVLLSFGYEDPLALLSAAQLEEDVDAKAFVSKMLKDQNISVMLTDSQTLARLGIAEIRFMLPTLSLPYSQEPEAQKDAEFRCIVPTVEDRDFSLVAYVADKLPDNTAVYLSSEANYDRLPEALMPFTRVYEPDEEHILYSGALAYLPAPRVLDYRLGVIPIEILQAAMAGTLPILVNHTVLSPLARWLPIEQSLTSITSTLLGLLNGDKEIEEALVKFRADHGRLSPQHMAQSILDAYWTRDGQAG
jgi:hypothetical protein